MNKKPRGLKTDGTPNAHWQRFMARLNETVPLSDWENEQVLGYILKRYQDLTGEPWAFSFGSGPKTCPEMYCVNRMITALGTEDWVKVKKYVDFVYDRYIIPNKTNITSLAFFFTKKFIFDFKAECKKKNIISRSTKLPDEYKKIIDSLNVKASTYGDLIFAKMAVDSDPEDNEEYIDLFKQLEQIGFKKETLEKLSA